jgi:segregation and condensation protein B
MSLKSKIEAVIYASEEPVTLQQLVGLLAGEAQSELDELAAEQASLPLEEQSGDAAGTDRLVVEAGTHEQDELDTAVAEALEQGEVVDVRAEIAIDVVPDAVVEPQEKAATDGEQAETAPGVAETDTAATPVVAEPNPEEEKRQQRERDRAVRDHMRRVVDALIREYAEGDRGIEIREVASGFRMGTKPEYHDAVRGFVKSLKPALKLTLPALETLAVVAYKQPVTAAEISEIRGVDSAGVLGGLMTRKLIATAGRKQVIGRPMLYKTTRDFLLRFGLKDVNELPSMEEFERMAGELAEQEDLPMDGTDAIIEEANARGDAEMIREDAESQQGSESGSQQDVADGVASAEDQPVNEADSEQATAESAAGGNDEEGSEQVSESASEQVRGAAEGSEVVGEEPVDENNEAAEEPQTAG